MNIEEQLEQLKSQVSMLNSIVINLQCSVLSSDDIINRLKLRDENFTKAVLAVVLEGKARRVL